MQIIKSRAAVLFTLSIFLALRTFSVQAQGVTTYPGVYLEEKQTGAKTVRGVDASVAEKTRKAVRTNSDSSAIRCNDGYRKIENQLYRVDIHGQRDNGPGTMRWSREDCASPPCQRVRRKTK
jgi:hypothetical protein